MNTQNIWTFLLTHTVVQGGLIFLVLLLIKDGNRAAKKVMAWLTLVFALLTLNYLAEYFRWFDAAPHLIWVTAPLWFLPGPLVLLFTSFSTKADFHLRWHHAIHLLPFLLSIVYILPFYQLDAAEKWTYFEDILNQKGVSNPYYLYAYLASMAIYFSLSAFLFHHYFQRAHELMSNGAIYGYTWIKYLFLILAAFVVGAMLYAQLLTWHFTSFITIDYLTYLLLCISVQFIGMIAIHFPKQFFVSPISDFQESANESNLSEAQLQQHLQQLHALMEKEQPYTDPTLRLSDLSLKLNIPAHQLSQILNQEVGKNFFQFINDYRVEAVKRYLLGPEYVNYTILAIALMCGFNSSTSFYRIFKQQTGVTPKEFRSNYLERVE
ncbi:MAG: hypothetical protein DHS20C18_20580 [Saprospiraceae bacterium]|nr:MAG: hypothetical protein DHS20C18_20580 [Saprospiraceae bacterium]